MLKIKDNIELKELEKFGFKYEVNGCGTEYYAKINEEVEYTGYGHIVIVINEKEFPNHKNKEKMIPRHIPIDLLFDLIQAGLVEKV